MLTAMVAGYYEPNGNEVYAPGADTYGEYCYGVQDMCNPVPCSFVDPPSTFESATCWAKRTEGKCVAQTRDENGMPGKFIYPLPDRVPLPVEFFSLPIKPKESNVPVPGVHYE